MTRPTHLETPEGSVRFALAAAQERSRALRANRQNIAARVSEEYSTGLLNALIQMEHDARDAARYRWLRDDNAYAPEESQIRGGADLDHLCDAERDA